VRTLWLRVHGLRYAHQASVQINTSDWIPLNNNTVTIAELGRSYGGIGGGFSTLVMTVPVPNGAVVGGNNTIRFRFNQTDGIVSSFRILAFNFLTVEGKKVLAPENFVEDTPESWTPPLPDAASIQAGKELWHTASLVASSIPNSPRIQAHCADCHAQDGRDLKYFNFSNASIVSRARFHGLSTLQSEQIASYIRSLPLPNPGGPWNPPYQPGPGLDEKPTGSSSGMPTHCSIWFAGVAPGRTHPCQIRRLRQRKMLPISLSLRSRSPRTCFAPTAISVLVKFPSPCNFRIGTNGCRASIPRMHGDQNLRRAPSQPRTMGRRRRARARSPADRGTSGSNHILSCRLDG
jgi:hypothetical protein